MNTYDKEYKALTLRLGFALLLMLVLLQGLMTLLGIGQMMLASFLTEKVSNILYWGLYNAFYFAAFMLPVPFFMMISRKIATEKMYFDLRLPRGFVPMSLATVGIVTGVGQINALLTAPFAGEDTSSDMLLDLVAPGKGYMVVLVFVMLVIVPPFCEEFLFRGLVLGNLLPYGKGVAVVGSALLFAAMHQSFSQFLYTVVAGVLLGLLYVESRSIWPSTLVHMINNLISFVQMMLISRIEDEMMANRLVICMNLLLMLVGILCAVWVLVKRKKEQARPDLSNGAFGHEPDRSFFAGDKPLSPGMTVRGFFSPTVIVFLCLSVAMAVLALAMEAVA